MEVTEEYLVKKIEAFYREGVKYYGKEIFLGSNQFFSIDEVLDKEANDSHRYNYTMQYGFPQSGCVSLNFCYSESDGAVFIEKIRVYAPAADKDFSVVNFLSQNELDEFELSVNFGIDIGTLEHSDADAIVENPNALKMLDVAITDLASAVVVCDFNVAVPTGSSSIPCAHSTNKLPNKEKTL